MVPWLKSDQAYKCAHKSFGHDQMASINNKNIGGKYILKE